MAPLPTFPPPLRYPALRCAGTRTKAGNTMSAQSMTSRLLVPLDGSALAESALAWAISVAQPGAELLLLRVVPPPGALRDAVGNLLVSASEFADRYRSDARETFDHAESTTAIPDGLTVEEIVVASADPAGAILRVAAERDASMIVVASAGRGSLGRITFGSVADRIARQADRPVLVVRAAERAGQGAVQVNRVVVPLDGSPVAAAAIPPATGLARSLGVGVALVTAVDTDRSTSLARVYASSFSEELHQKLVKQEATFAGEMLDGVAAEIRKGGIPVSVAVIDGPAAASIADVTQSGDLIVMMSHGRGGVQRWLIGSIAEKLVREAPVPVVLLHPKESLATRARQALETAIAPFTIPGRRGSASGG